MIFYRLEFTMHVILIIEGYCTQVEVFFIHLCLMDIGFDELVQKFKERKVRDRKERQRIERALKKQQKKAAAGTAAK